MEDMCDDTYNNLEPPKPSKKEDAKQDAPVIESAKDFAEVYNNPVGGGGGCFAGDC